MESNGKDLKYTIIAEGSPATLWRCHPTGDYVATEYKDGPWLMSRFSVGTKIHVGSREERNGRSWYETPIVAKILSIKHIRTSEVRVTFTTIDGSMWALDVAPDDVHNDPSLEFIHQAVEEYSLDTLFFLNKSYDNGGLL